MFSQFMRIAFRSREKESVFLYNATFHLCEIRDEHSCNDYYYVERDE